MANEKRLIDAVALKRHMIRAMELANLPTITEDDLVYAIDHSDTVDAVEVVRCKDCKHYDNSEGICWCHINSKFYPGGFDWHSFPEDGFCSYGERRTNEQEKSDL